MAPRVASLDWHSALIFKNLNVLGCIVHCSVWQRPCHSLSSYDGPDSCAQATSLASAGMRFRTLGIKLK